MSTRLHVGLGRNPIRDSVPNHQKRGFTKNRRLTSLRGVAQIKKKDFTLQQLQVRCMVTSQEVLNSDMLHNFRILDM
jgi:hypothetical protein